MSNLKPVAWMHTLDNTEGIEGNEPEVVVTFSKKNPFGRPGIDYSKSFPVTSIPLYSAPPEATAPAEVEFVNRPGEASLIMPVQDCTEPNRGNCPRRCIDFCNKAEQAIASAQDLSAAIPNWSGIADRLNELDKAIVQSTNLTPQSKPRRLLYAILHEVCSSPVNALSAGDSQKPWWADEEMFKFAERYRELRKIPINLNPFVHERVSGKLLDFRIDQRLLAASPDQKLPWERAILQSQKAE